MTAEERAQSYIRERAGTAYCAACLGRDLRLTPFEAQNVMWRLQESPAFLLRSGQCSSCQRTRRVLSEAPDAEIIGCEVTVIAFLLSRAGEAFCDACLAFGTELSLEEARRSAAYLKALPEFSHADGECSVCGRSRPVAVAAGAVNGNGAEHASELADMVTGTVRYRGWRIDILSYEMRSGWRSFVAIQSPQRVVVPHSAAASREAFPTRAEADAFALQRAKEWIDKRN